jgi:hypothetical protein
MLSKKKIQQNWHSNKDEEDNFFCIRRSYGEFKATLDFINGAPNFFVANVEEEDSAEFNDVLYCAG